MHIYFFNPGAPLGAIDLLELSFAFKMGSHHRGRIKKLSENACQLTVHMTIRKLVLSSICPFACMSVRSSISFFAYPLVRSCLRCFVCRLIRQSVGTSVQPAIRQYFRMSFHASLVTPSINTFINCQTSNRPLVFSCPSTRLSAH